MISSATHVLWKQVWAIALVQGAISLCWLIYGLYIPKLLESLGFGEEVVLGLLTIENFMAAAIEPIMGGLSDQWQRWLGTRMPIIVVGTLLAAALFICIPLAVLYGGDLQKIVVLGIVIIWAISMAVFRSPVVAMLGNFAVGTGLPQAVSILTLMGGLVGAVRSLASGFILSLGASVAFGLGSVALLVGVGTLRHLSRQRLAVVTEVTDVMAEPMGRRSPLPWWRLGFLLGLGVAMGWGLRLIFGEVIPRLIKQYNPAQFDLLMGTGFILMAGFAVLSAYGIKQIQRSGRSPGLNHAAIVLGLFVVILSIWLLSLNLSAGLTVAVGIVMLAGLGTANNLMIPLGLEFLPVGNGGMALGMYFGGTGLAIALFNLLITKPASLAFLDMALMAQLALAIAGIGCGITKPKMY
jgi:MFS family permease